ncbi:DUF1127 domain-containing protein [Azospirillum sp. sgz302134]
MLPSTLARPKSIALAVLALVLALFRSLPRQRAITDLHRVDDRLLRDIGLTRADILAATRLGRRTDGADP